MNNIIRIRCSPIWLGMLMCIESGNEMDKPRLTPEQDSADRMAEPDQNDRSPAAIAQRVIRTSEAFFLGEGIPDGGE